jgi:hypothetical protein
MSPYSIPEDYIRTDPPVISFCSFTVVDHLDVVASTGLADPVAARLAVDLGSGRLEDLLDGGPRGRGATGHDGWAVAGTLLTTGDTGADEEEALGLELLRAADRVRVVRVATVNDDVTLLKVRLELADEVVDGRAGLDEEDDLARRLELLAELLDRVGADDLGACVRAGSICVADRVSGRRNAPLASLARKASTLLVVRLYATTVKPLSFMFIMRFWPCSRGQPRARSGIKSRGDHYTP